jgi:hypothetical protein
LPGANPQTRLACLLLGRRAGPLERFMDQPSESDRATAPTTSAASAERRALVRYRCERPARSRAFIANSYRSIQARVLDLSIEGLGVLLREPVSLGTRLTVELDGPSDSVYELHAEVLHVTAQADGSWRCGCRLAWRLSDGELRLLLKGPDTPSPR